MTSSTHRGVWIFSEIKENNLELLALGRTLADQLETPLATLAFGERAEERTEEYISYGADKVYVCNQPTLNSFMVEPYTDVIGTLAQQYQPEIILVGASKRGKELAPRLAARLKTGCAADCISLNIEPGTRSLVVQRVAFSGNALATQVYHTRPQIATVPFGISQKLPEDVARKGEVIKVNPSFRMSRVKVIETRERKKTAVNLEAADIVVSVGRGINKKEDISLIQELAQVLNGEVGCSRPIAADLQWLSEDHWVGLSKHKVRPKLYIAVGISGQIQHIAGIRDARIILAINRDEEAPIFKAADYGLKGDLYQVVPVLTEAFKRLLGKG
jgi:electron transfer flavoprotein alpha subunit